MISLHFYCWVSKTRGSHKNSCVWPNFEYLFPLLKTQKFEFEWWNSKTTFECFQKLRIGFQWVRSTALAKSWVIRMRYVTECLFVSAFSTPKAHFEEKKYKKPVWLDIKRNFLEKVAFRIWTENAHSQNGALRCILEKLLCVDESIRWVIGSVTKLPSLLLKSLTWPFLFFLIFFLLYYRPTPIKKYQPHTNIVPPNYHRSTNTIHFNIW